MLRNLTDWLCSIVTHPAAVGSSSPWEPGGVTRNTLKFKEISVHFFTITRGSVTTTHRSVCLPSLFSVPDPQALHQLDIHPIEEIHKSKLHLHTVGNPFFLFSLPMFSEELAPSCCSLQLCKLFHHVSVIPVFLWLHAELWFLLLPPQVAGICILLKLMSFYLSNWFWGISCSCHPAPFAFHPVQCCLPQAVISIPHNF